MLFTFIFFLPLQPINPTGNLYKCIEWSNAPHRSDCFRIQNHFQLMSNVWLLVSLSKSIMKIPPSNTFMYFYHQWTEQASGKGPSTVLCISKKTHFCGKTQKCHIYLTCCLPPYDISWYVIGVLLLTNYTAECRHHTLWLQAAKWICSFEGYTCHKQTSGLHQLVFQGLVIMTNSD